jgi:hypothetical protein
MSSPQVTTGDRIIDPMIALAGCSTRQRIVVAGSKSMELMLELHRRGYLLAAAGAIAAVQPVSTTLRLWIGGDARFTRLRRRWTGW